MANVLFIYTDPGEDGVLPAPKNINIDALTPENAPDLAMLESYCPVDIAKGLLNHVEKYRIWLGIGKRAPEVAARWKESSHPWLPKKITIPGDKPKDLIEEDAAPVTQGTLYYEVNQLVDLCDLYNYCRRNKGTLIQSIAISPAWRQPDGKRIEIEGTGIFDDNLEYLLSNVPPEIVERLIYAMRDEFRNILPDLALDPKNPIKVIPANCIPQNRFSNDGLCGAWYILEFEGLLKDGRKTEKTLKVRVPVGLIKPGKGAGDNLEPVRVSFSGDKKDVYTYSLNFRFLCKTVGLKLANQKSKKVEKLGSVNNFLNTFLKSKKIPECGSEIGLDPVNKFLAHNCLEQWKGAKSAVDEAADGTDKQTKTATLVQSAREIVTDIIGEEPLAIFTPKGVLLLQNKKQIAAWGADNKLLDMFYYGPPWLGTEEWVKNITMADVFDFNGHKWKQQTIELPGGRACLEDEVLGIKDAKDCIEQLTSALMNKIPGTPIDKDTILEFLSSKKVLDFRKEPHMEFINSLWNKLTTPGSMNVKAEAMCEPANNTDPLMSLPTGWHMDKTNQAGLWKKLCVGFRIEGAWGSLQSTLDRYQAGGGKGMTQWRINDDFMYKTTGYLTFKGTVLDGTVEANTRIARMWNKNNDTFNETAICVSRNFFGATAFPLRPAVGKFALFAVDCLGLVGYDTESYQANLKPNRVWRPGEKAFISIPYNKVIGWVWIERNGCEGDGWKFSIDPGAKWVINQKWNINTSDLKRKADIIKYIEGELEYWQKLAQPVPIPAVYDFRNE